jgi:hypothetical protein
VVHPFTSQVRRNALRSIAILSLLTAVDYPNNGWALVVRSPPPDDDIRFVAEASPPSPTKPHDGSGIGTQAPNHPLPELRVDDGGGGGGGAGTRAPGNLLPAPPPHDPSQ